MGGSGSYTAAYPDLLAVATHRARRVLGDDSDAAEVAQEALLRAFVSWDDIASYAPQWVSRVAMNLAISRLRQRRRVWPDSLAILDGDTGVDAQIDLGRAVAALPLRQRQVVVLRHLADLPEREVAEMLGISSGSVKRHLHRALVTLGSPASGLAAAYSMTEVGKEELMVTPWRTRHEPAVEPAGGWPTRPWDHRYLEDEGSVVRVAVDQSGSVVLDAEGDEVQSGPGFDYEVAKVHRGRAVPHRETAAVPVDSLEPAMLEILNRAGRMGEVFGHSWVGEEHLGLALVERSSKARGIVGASWAVLASAVAEFYEGPYAAARLRLVNQRVAAGWVPTPLEAEVAPLPNWALRQLLQRACELAKSEGRPQATLLDVAHQVIGPSTIESPGGTTRTTPSFMRLLLDQAQSTASGRGEFARSGRSAPLGPASVRETPRMVARFTDMARSVLPLAQEEANLLRASFIGTEHILLGLTRQQDGLAAHALATLGISGEAVREKVVEMVGLVGSSTTSSPPFSPATKAVLELAHEEALQRDHNYVGTEHILLGLVGEGGGVAARVLVKLGVDNQSVRLAVMQLLAEKRAE